MRQGNFTLPCNFGIGFCQLNLYQKLTNSFGGENWHIYIWLVWHPDKLIEPYKTCSLVALKMSNFFCFLSLCQLGLRYTYNKEMQSLSIGQVTDLELLRSFQFIDEVNFIRKQTIDIMDDVVWPSWLTKLG